MHFGEKSIWVPTGNRDAGDARFIDASFALVADFLQYRDVALAETFLPHSGIGCVDEIQNVLLGNARARNVIRKFLCELRGSARPVAEFHQLIFEFAVPRVGM